MGKITTYYAIKMKDGYHVMQRVEYDPPVEYTSVATYDTKEQADELIASITGRLENDGSEQ